jgi:hypothetical protein
MWRYTNFFVSRNLSALNGLNFGANVVRSFIVSNYYVVVTNTHKFLYKDSNARPACW